VPRAPTAQRPRAAPGAMPTSTRTLSSRCPTAR
jgi:hypothetical protein